MTIFKMYWRKSGERTILGIKAGKDKDFNEKIGTIEFRTQEQFHDWWKMLGVDYPPDDAREFGCQIGGDDNEIPPA